jgi:hypothetical protein
MRAHTITVMARRRRRARRRAIALVLAVCALAIPASASAKMSVDGLDSSEATGIASALHDPATTPDGGYPTVNGIDSSQATGVATALHDPGPTLASGSPSGAEQWFDVPSALVGAGSAMAIVALGGAAFLTVRRQREVSPSASTS